MVQCARKISAHCPMGENRLNDEPAEDAQSLRGGGAKTSRLLLVGASEDGRRNENRGGCYASERRRRQRQFRAVRRRFVRQRDWARELNHSPHSCRKHLASIALGSSKRRAPWSRSSVRAVRNLRWICCNTMARSAIRDRSSDMPEPVPRQSNPRAPQLTAVSGCHSCRRSGAELPREPARRPAKQ